MKRSISLLLVAVLTLMTLTACSSETTVYTGLGVTTSAKESIAPAGSDDGTVQVDSTVASITLDENGTILKLSIDSPQTRIVFTSKGRITSGLSALVQSKRERGTHYGMLSHSSIGKEWYEQIAAFETWAIGKTVDEVMGLATKKVDDAHPQVPDDPELAASVTITIEDYRTAIEKAAANAKAATVGESFKTGLGIVTRINQSVDATVGSEGRAQVDSVVAAVTLNDKGKIVACSLDNAQTRVPFTNKGEFTADVTAECKTVIELGNDYGAQAQDFADWAVGKTLEELKGTKPYTVTMNVSDFMTAIEKAIENAV